MFFVGDAANTSCTHEFARFLARMHGTPWFGALGNHDGYYMGNLTFAADAGPARGVNHGNTWQGACECGDQLDHRTLSAIATLEYRLLLQPDANSEQDTLTKAVAIWI